MRILYLSHRLPDAPDKGCKIRAFHQLRALGQRHEVHLLALADTPEAASRTGTLRESCASVEVFPRGRAASYARGIGSLVRRSPATLGFFHSPPLRRRCAALARESSWDLIFAYSSSMAPYGDQFAGVPRILDMVDVDSAKWAQYARLGSLGFRPVFALEARRLAAYETRSAASYDRVLVCSQREREQLLALAPDACTTTVRLGIDHQRFRPLPLPKSSAPSIVFTGQMDYLPNVDAVTAFTRDHFPALRRRFPQLELVIVGRAPSRRVRTLAEVAGVTVTGAVEDVRPFLARAWLFVAPLRIAQGVQTKVLEAMAAELPVVCTPRVLDALREGGLRNGEDLRAVPYDEIGSAVAGLLDDPGARQRMARSATAKVADAYDWERNLGSFVTAVEATAARGSARRDASARAALPFAAPRLPSVPGPSTLAGHRAAAPASARAALYPPSAGAASITVPGASPEASGRQTS